MAGTWELVNRILADRPFLSFEKTSRAAQKSILRVQGPFCQFQGWWNLGSKLDPRCASERPVEIPASWWLENRFSQKSSELESFQTLGLRIPFGSSKSSSAVNLMKKIDLVDFRMISHGKRFGAKAAKTAFFGCRSSLNPLRNFLSKCVENCQVFIFRKSKPKTPSYFKMSKKTRSEPILSSETWF